MSSRWAPRETRAAGRHALSRRAGGINPAATSLLAPRLVIRQARRSLAQPARPFFWSDWSVTSHHQGAQAGAQLGGLCADLHVFFNHYCSALLMRMLKTHRSTRYARSPRRSAAPRHRASARSVAVGPHARKFASAADSVPEYCSGATTARVASANQPEAALEHRS